MQIAILVPYYYDTGAPPAVAPTTTHVQIDLPAEPEHEFALTGACLLGD